MTRTILDYLNKEDGPYSIISGDKVAFSVPKEHSFFIQQAFPTLQERHNYAQDLEIHKGVAKQDVSVNYSTEIEISVVESGAGYDNTLGVYTIDFDGTIRDVVLAYDNVKTPLMSHKQIEKLENNIAKLEQNIAREEALLEKVKFSSFLTDIINTRIANHHASMDDLKLEVESLTLKTSPFTYNYDHSNGASLGTFIIADGYNKNSHFENLDLVNGKIRFVYDLGGAAERYAKITDSAEDISLIYQNGGTITILNGNVFHATDPNGNNGINPDAAQHTISGLANEGDPSVLRLGFEDLKNLGDADYNDVVIDIKVKSQDASAPNYDDVLLGDASDNIFIGGEGNNTISGRGGSDTIDYSNAGPNLVVDLDDLYGSNNSTFTDRLIGISNVIGTQFDDRITGSNGDNIIYAFAGNDILLSGAGNDEIHAGAGNDEIDAGVGDDVVYGEDGNDYIDGFDGADILWGGNGDDRIWAGAGNDAVHGDAGHDQIYGQDGDDAIYGGDGNDYIEGGAGNDFIQSGSGVNTVYGGNGIDTADYSDRLSAIKVSLTTGAAIESNGDRDTLNSIENVNGTNFDDTLEGDGQDNILNGLAGNDRLYGWNGHDTIFGGLGNDVLYGGEGDDVLNGDAGNDNLYGHAGNDTLNGGDGTDQLYGYEGNDVLNGGNDRDLLYGMDGDDVLHGGAGNDYLEGGAGNDILYGDAGLNTIYGGAGNDTFVFEGETAFDTMDHIMDFAIGDTIDISDILVDIGYDPNTELISDWVRIQNNSYHSYLQIDRDGDSSGFGFTTIAVTENYNNLLLEDLAVSQI